MNQLEFEKTLKIMGFATGCYHRVNEHCVLSGMRWTYNSNEIFLNYTNAGRYDVFINGKKEYYGLSEEEALERITKEIDERLSVKL